MKRKNLIKKKQLIEKNYFELIICGILECVKSRRDLYHLLFVSVVKRFSLIVLIAHCLFFIGSAFRKKRKKCHVSYNTYHFDT